MLALITHPAYSYPFPDKHRFPMQKFRLLVDYLKQQGIATEHNLIRPGKAQPALLSLAHDTNYIQAFCQGTLSEQALRRMGLPWSEELVKRSLISPAGTWLSAQYALKYGMACHLAGGTHHAHHDFGSGFCIFNDLAVTALALIRSKKAKKVLIFDCDVHQGDGTATILANEENCITCSIHCEKNFPARKAQSDIDINLSKGLADIAYLDMVASTLKQCLIHQPDFVIYDAGVDIYIDDTLGLLNISLDGIRQRDKLVIETVRKLNLPLLTVIGGGYDKNEFELAKRHAIVVEELFKMKMNY